ncbi:MAG: glycosyltransferase family 2 protein [Alkalibacterium sp.]|nr:glycosyltransferase family 2 protein [Alkalibacterium sp.]
MNNNLTISVVIPTTDRIDFLTRAVSSVLNQELQAFELVVVIDGKSSDSVSYLREIKKNSKVIVKYFETNNKVGGSEARNIGVKMSSGDLVALMDDDDEWFKTKLKSQYDLIIKNNINSDRPFLCFTSLLTYNSIEDKKLKKLPNTNYSDFGKFRLIDYLFETDGLKNIGFIQSSTILVPRWLIKKTPFTKGLPKHQDWDWLLKIDKEYNLSIIQVESVQIIYHSDVPKKTRVGYQSKWSATKNFYIKWSDSFSENGRYSFILNYLVLGLSQLDSIDKKERMRLCLKLLNGLPKCVMISPYSLKTMIYIIKDMM